MPCVRAARQCFRMACDTLLYWRLFWRLWWLQESPAACARVLNMHVSQRCLVHMYTLAATLRLWDAPHYRATSFAQDLRDNLCNIAIPGTGMPLSVWCRSRAAALIFIVAVNPVVSLAAAVLTAVLQQPQPRQQPASPDVAAGALAACSDISATYHSLLLEPQHWFAVWRHNCLLVGLHALRTGSASYGLENKGAFLREGSRLGLPVSPFYADAAAVFVKHVAIEGGMGIHHFSNFAHGGQWVIQRALSNSEELSRLLPPGAPLSTLRVVTASHSSLVLDPPRSQAAGAAHGSSEEAGTRGGSASEHAAGLSKRRGVGGAGAPPLPLSEGVVAGAAALPSPAPPTLPALSSARSSPVQQAPAAAAGGAAVSVVTAVWRAGRAGKHTDHASLCFSVDPATGLLGRGVSSSHWYQLGRVGRLGQFARRHDTHHPDSGAQVAGATLSCDVPGAMRAVAHAHLVAARDVPLIGWDVALTPEGLCLLEMNISCNLFDGQYDAAAHYGFLLDLLCALH